MPLTQERERLYTELESRVGNTPLVEFTALAVPNGNRIFLKDESNTLKGAAQPVNHYGRVFPAVYHELEEKGRIRPLQKDKTLRQGNVVFDTSQGNAALALTVVGNMLGFVPFAIVPRGHVSAKMKAYLSAAGANIVETENGDYVNDFEKALKRFRDDFRAQQGITPVFLNHSMGPYHSNNETTLKALESIADETLQQMQALGIKPDYFIGVWGNGSSLFGPARLLEQHGVESIGWELFSQAVAYELAYPGRYTEEFGIDLKVLGDLHGVPGSSYRGKGTPIDFPHIMNAVTGTDPVIKDTRLVADSRMLAKYTQLTTDEKSLRHAAALPRLDSTMNSLLAQGLDFGRTSAGNLAVALDLASKVEGKTIVTLVYDRLDKYDTPLPK